MSPKNFWRDGACLLFWEQLSGISIVKARGIPLPPKREQDHSSQTLKQLFTLLEAGALFFLETIKPFILFLFQRERKGAGRGERGRDRELIDMREREIDQRERETSNMDWLPPICTLTGD